MIHNSYVKNIIKTSDSVTSTHLVIAEWNMNRYSKVGKSGIYIGPASEAPSTYNANDTSIEDGKTFYLFDDNTNKDSPDAEYFSNLSSVFTPDRPDPGIVLTQNYAGLFLSDDATQMKAAQLSTSNPRFYPFSRNRKYSYFNSAKIIDRTVTNQTNKDEYSGVSTVDGAIKNCNPFVVYENPLVCNKILISVQHYRSVPKIFWVDVLIGSNWTNIYSSTNSSVWSDGKLQLYYNGTWSTTVSRVTDLSQIAAAGTQSVSISGIRLRVAAMESIPIQNVAGVTRRFKSSLELIEISPRLEADVSAYTETFSFNSAIADSEFGLPVGKLVSSNGEISLSNESGVFLLSSPAAIKNMLSNDVEFRFYQKILNENTQTYENIPLKVMYSDAWDIGTDFTAKVELSDKMRIFQETNVIDMCIFTRNGIPFSVIILTLLDNLGITGYEFKKSNNENTSEDTRITTFFCNKEQTLAEVLEEIAISTQSAMFIDAYGNLNVMTKERIVNAEPITDSTSETSGGTDFWVVYDNNYVGTAEEAYITGYKPNVSTSQESKIDPVTDGTVTYHSYGIRKRPGIGILSDSIPKDILNDTPANSIVGSGFSYAPKIIWSPGSDSEKVLGAANLLKKISSNRVKTQFTGQYTKINKEEVVRQMVAQSQNDNNKAESLLIYLDRNEIYTFGSKKGYIMIDEEIIAYNGIQYSVVNRRGDLEEKVVIFTNEQLDEYIKNAARRSSIVPIALVIDVRLNLVDKNDNGTYDYEVIGDGRGQFGTTVTNHEPFNQQNFVVSNDDLFGVVIGGRPNEVAPGSSPILSTKYNFARVPSIVRVSQALDLPPANYDTYLGYLIVAGRKSPSADRRALEGTATESLNAQNKINEQVDELVPGTEFDPYVYRLGERFIYGYKVDLDFTPNIIGTRMRLFSPVTNTNGPVNEMSTNSSIAGIGFGLKYSRGTRAGQRVNIITGGYFLEVESISGAKNFASGDTFKNNLRLYKLESINGKLTPKLLAVAGVNAFTTTGVMAEVSEDSDMSADPVFDLEIRIAANKNNVRYRIYYGGREIETRTPITEKTPENYFRDIKNVFVFVRNDSQAIYENIYAASKPTSPTSRDAVFRIEPGFRSTLRRGYIAQNLQTLFNNNQYKFKYLDFGKIAREVKKYDARYESPVLFSRIIDISRVNPKYMIISQKYTSFGAEIVVANTSNTAITISEESSLPLYVFGPQLEELSSGDINAREYYKKIDDDLNKISDLSFNKSVHGEKAFNIDGTYIESPSQANQLMDWILTNCSRQRMKISMEVFANPLIELGDKVRIFSSDRGYQESNTRFGSKVFTVCEINRSVNNDGPTMNICLLEVGAS